MQRAQELLDDYIYYVNIINNNEEDEQIERRLRVTEKKLFKALTDLCNENGKYLIEYVVNRIIKVITITPQNLKELLDKIKSGFEENRNIIITSDSFNDFDIHDVSSAKIINLGQQRVNNDGGYFPYYNKTEFDLTKYQIFKKEEEKDDNHCLYYALEKTNMLSKSKLDKLKLSLSSSNFPKSKLNELCKDLDIQIVLSEYLISNNQIDIKKYNKENNNCIIYLGLYKDHFFINDIIPIHKIAISLRDDDKFKNNKRKMEIYRYNGKSFSYKKKYSCKAIQIIKEIYQTNGFEKISFEDHYKSNGFLTLSKKEQNEEFDILQKDLDLDIKVPINEEDWRINFSHIVFADYECVTDGNQHKADTVGYQILKCFTEKGYEIRKKIKSYKEDLKKKDSEDTKKIINSLYSKLIEEFLPIFKKEPIKIKTSTKAFLNDIPEDSLIYFHNLKYDWTQIFPDVYLIDSCDKDNQLYSTTVKFYKKTLYFRDNYKLIPTKLEQFHSMFKIKSFKEIMPYNLYTSETIKKATLKISDALLHIKKNKHEQFLKNLEELNMMTDDKKEFYHMSYRRYYCYKDVELLQEGFIKFRELCLNALKLDVINFLSISSLADNYFINQGCFDGIVQLSGTARAFVQKSIIGGRVMTKDNKAFKINKNIVDFDAVSLYPSAMNRIKGYPIGKAKLLKIDENEFKFTPKDYKKSKISKLNHFVVEIKITKVRKSFDIPMFTYKDKDSKRVWENKEPEENIIIDKVMLEDCVKYHEIDFEIKRGIYWNEGFNPKVKETVEKLFKLRLDAKKNKNPIQEIYKLILNSAYGKTCLKETKTKTKYIYGEEEYKKFIIKNFNLHKETVIMKTNLNKKCFKIILNNSVFDHVNRVHCGGIILSMSKRIMNEVTFAASVAKKEKINIYYVDTDSMHIEKDKLKDLEKNYKKLYKRDLIGKNLGQFHSDFSLMKEVDDGKHIIDCEDVYATETILVDKKIYCDKIRGKKVMYELDEFNTRIDSTKKEFFNENGDPVYLEDFHFRLKGVSSNSIKYYAEQHYNNDISKIFKSNKIIEFDLLADDQVKFEYIKNGGICSKNKFNRKIDFRRDFRVIPFTKRPEVVISN